jgi:hypothetical protein
MTLWMQCRGLPNVLAFDKRTRHAYDIDMSKNFTPPSSQADRIIRKFGGLRPMAKMLGMENHTTVQTWKRYGYIGFQYWSKILGVAVWNDIPVTLHDFTADLEEQYQVDVERRSKAFSSRDEAKEPAWEPRHAQQK